MKQNFVTKGETCRAGGGFSPLRRAFRGTPFFMRAAFTSIQTKPKQEDPALKGVFCAPWGSSSLQYLWGYCCFVCRPNPSQNALFQGAKQSQAGRLPQMQGKARR